MKKQTISALALTLIFFASVGANAQSKTSEEQSTSVAAPQDKPATTSEKSSAKEKKVAIKPEDLPDGVKKTINGEEFSGWKVTKAFLVTDADQKQYYELSVAKGSESARVKLDKDGNNAG